MDGGSVAFRRYPIRWPGANPRRVNLRRMASARHGRIGVREERWNSHSISFSTF